MSPTQFEARLLPQIEEFLRGMPSVWFTENQADNAWDMLVEMWPGNEPGLGLWDHIQDLILVWMVCVLREQPLDQLREYWETSTSPERGLDRCGDRTARTGDEPASPDLDTLCADIAQSLFGDLLDRAEEEGLRRR